ncbi:GTP cyclohydrolase N terminal-domain-containing protein [Bisporella sp. PMI_857]|nr:GTP cyclohydrolase N terminal-domain-containing protein [Bisporella sp. PMI_857]
MDLGHKDPQMRGPVAVARNSQSAQKRIRNIDSSNTYSHLYVGHISRTQKTAIATVPVRRVAGCQHWAISLVIVLMDPPGHLATWLFRDIIKTENGICIPETSLRPLISNELPELEQSVRERRLGGYCALKKILRCERAATKLAVEPVWSLPYEVSERFDIEEGALRRSLFEHTGGSYPDLITCCDIKVFLPPIGTAMHQIVNASLPALSFFSRTLNRLIIYCFGDPAKVSNENVRLALSVHDEVRTVDLLHFRLGGDVFGSDICTCPYLIYGIEEVVKEAQLCRSGSMIFQERRRALGEVMKHLVYNARKRGLDRALDYFKRTGNIA